MQVPDPKLDFEFTVDVQDKAVTFINNSEGVTDFQWAFGDQQTSTEKSPRHSYKTEGTYKVILKAVSLKTKEPLTLEKEVVVGNATGNLPNSELSEPANLDFAGFDVSWTNVNNEVSGIRRVLQVATNANFEQSMELTLANGTALNVTDLNPDTQYWIRIVTTFNKISNNGSATTYSNVKNITTADFPQPSIDVVEGNNQLAFNEFQVVAVVPSSTHLFKNAITQRLNVRKRASSNTMEPAIPVSTTVNGYIKEPLTQYSLELVAVYQGVEKQVSKEYEITSKFIAKGDNREGWKGGYTKKYIQNAKTMLEFGDSETGKKVVFQIAGFRGVGGEIVELRHNENWTADGKNSINTADDSYAYLLNGSSPFKFYLSRMNQRLELYRITDQYYYFRTNASDAVNMLFFRQDQDEVTSLNSERLYDTYFAVER